MPENVRKYGSSKEEAEHLVIGILRFVHLSVHNFTYLCYRDFYFIYTKICLYKRIYANMKLLFIFMQILEHQLRIHMYILLLYVCACVSN